MESAFRSFLTCLLLAFLVLTLSVGAFAQVSKGSISGTVVDPTGAIVPGAGVKATNAETNQAPPRLATVPDCSSCLCCRSVPIGGDHKSGLPQSFPGRDWCHPWRRYRTGKHQIEVGSISETVEVTTATPLIETTQSQITNTFDTSDVASIPGLQENEVGLAGRVAAGVSASRDANRANTNGTGFVVNGLRGRSNDQEIDGQYNNDNSVTGPAIFVGNSEFVNQYQITTNNFGAEYGRNAGSVVNITTKSGSNTWHGRFTERRATPS